MRSPKRQDDETWRPGHGGARKGAGRRPKGGRSGVPHRRRPPLAARYPVHVTLRLRRELPSLRRSRPFAVLERAMEAGKERFGFRLIHVTVMSNHVHLLAEAKSRLALTRGLQGLAIRIAKALNRHWGRRGSVFADRYHGRVLRSPREVRAALAYVLRNAARHGLRFVGPDRYSSGSCFDGWEGRHLAARPSPLPFVVTARSWLLRKGWRRWRLVGFGEVPRGA